MTRKHYITVFQNPHEVSKMKELKGFPFQLPDGGIDLLGIGDGLGPGTPD